MRDGATKLSCKTVTRWYAGYPQSGQSSWGQLREQTPFCHDDVVYLPQLRSQRGSSLPSP